MNRLTKIVIAISSILLVPLLILLFYRLINGVNGSFKLTDIVQYFSEKNFFDNSKEQFNTIVLNVKAFGNIAYDLDYDYVHIGFTGWADFLNPVGDVISDGFNWIIGLFRGTYDILVQIFKLLVSILGIVWTFLLDFVDIVGWLFGLFDFVLTI